MDKRIILAVAGSGKTRHIISRLDLDKKYLLLTYTLNNYRNLKEGVINKYGHFPDNIFLHTYFNFLYSECIGPFLSYKYKLKGLNFEPNKNRFIRKSKLRYFIDSGGRLYSNRAAAFLKEKNTINDIIHRLEKYFDCMYIDEVQDIAGHDFNLLKNISKANIEMEFVGDFYQHTFDTGRDGKTNESLHKDYEKYKGHFEEMGFEIAENELDKSWRCSPTVCKFITDKTGIAIHSHQSEPTDISIISDDSNAERIFRDKNIVKLFYRENYKYSCYSRNWGDCKGENCYEDVCVVLNNKSLEYYEKNKLDKLSPTSKNKFYVACSRAKRNLYLVPEKLVKKHKK